MAYFFFFFNKNDTVGVNEKNFRSTRNYPYVYVYFFFYTHFTASTCETQLIKITLTRFQRTLSAKGPLTPAGKIAG